MKPWRIRFCVLEKQVGGAFLRVFDRPVDLPLPVTDADLRKV